MHYLSLIRKEKRNGLDFINDLGRRLTLITGALYQKLVIPSKFKLMAVDLQRFNAWFDCPARPIYFRVKSRSRRPS